MGGIRRELKGCLAGCLVIEACDMQCASTICQACYCVMWVVGSFAGVGIASGDAKFRIVRRNVNYLQSSFL